MPHEKMEWMPKKEILSFEEMERLVSIMASMGISKIRLTGGEPFVRTDLMQFIRRVVEIPGIRDLHLTTNGILTAKHIPELKRLGLSSVNLSLDTLDRKRFLDITRRDDFGKVMETLHLLLEHQIPVKINCVVMEGRNIDDIVLLTELARNHPVDVRFIEEMPFNGGATHLPSGLSWNHIRIIDHLRNHFPAITKIQDPAFSTSSNYRIEGFAGTVGVIAAFSRTFCGTCNRIRVTAQGELKTCLYDGGVLNIKTLMRNGASDEEITGKLLEAFRSRPKDGFEAEHKKSASTFASMSTIGG